MDIPVAVADVWGKGGEGTIELAEKVAKIATQCTSRHSIYQ